MQLIKHFWNNNRAEVVARSFRNCHCPGLDSIMLLDRSGQRIRLFVTRPEHEMWKNAIYPIRLPKGFGTQPMTIGFHPHHCDLTLVPVRGAIYNIVATTGYEMDSRPILRQLLGFEHSSAINGGSGTFRRADLPDLLHTKMSILGVGDSQFMRAYEIHTVYVSAGVEAAWLVYEGAEDPDYRAVTWSNVDLESFSPAGLYQRMDSAAIEKTLTELELL